MTERFRKQVGERIKVSDEPGHGEAMRVTIGIRLGWNEHCDWVVGSISLEEAADLRYALDRLLLNAQSSCSK